MEYKYLGLWVEYASDVAITICKLGLLQLFLLAQMKHETGENDVFRY